MNRLFRTFASLAFCLILSFGLATPLQAQPAGAEIISVTTPDEALRFHYPRRFAPAVEILERQGPQLFHKLEQTLGIENFPTVDVWVLPDLNIFYELHELQSRPPAWAVGLSFSKKRTILVLHGIGPNREPVDIHRTFAHELAHVAIDEATGEHRVPRWFNEGFAIMHADEWSAERSEMLARAAATGMLIPFESLTDTFPGHHNTVSVAYAQSFHFVRHLQSRYGDQTFARLTARVRAGEDFYVALEALTGEPFSVVQAEWREALEQGSSFWSIFRDENVFFFGASLLFLVAWAVRRKQKRKQLQAMSNEDPPEGWDYDDSRYPLPGDTYRPQ
ncbi:MAG: hypothetical protein H0U74_12105 [Bradymonadaceae bacterium]|nr:hypothetical protein [Lujinxingiaceae bacterium]